MKKAFIIIFMLTFCGCVNKESTKNSNFAHGTTIIIFSELDSMVIAADSRVGHAFTLSKQITYTDTTNKIQTFGNIATTFAGLGALGDAHLPEIVRHNYDRKNSIEKNALKLRTEITVEFQKALDKLNTTEANIFKTSVPNSYGTDFFIAGFEGNKPILYYIFFNVEVEKSRLIYVSELHKFDTNGIKFQPAGAYNHIMDYLNAGNRIGDNRVQEAIKLISYQAKFDNTIDSVVNYVVIKPNKLLKGITK